MDLGKVGTGVLTMIGGLCLMCEEASALVKLTSGSGNTPGMAIPRNKHGPERQTRETGQGRVASELRPRRVPKEESFSGSRGVI